MYILADRFRIAPLKGAAAQLYDKEAYEAHERPGYLQSLKLIIENTLPRASMKHGIMAFP